MKRNPDLKTPWSPGGHLMHHPGIRKMIDGEIVNPGVGEWRDNEPFTATLQMLGTERGRSAAFFRWQVVKASRADLVGAILPMFITDVGHVLMMGLAQPGGKITSEFFVVKRGQNYGITPAQPDEDVPPRGHERPTVATGAPSGS